MSKQNKRDELITNNWIVKGNVLNEIRHSRMNISQFRLFAIYLSKINPKDVSSREVSFRLEEYTKIMQFKQTNTTRLVNAAEDLLRLTITFFDKSDSKNGFKGFVTCQLFKRFRLEKKDDEWIVSIDCHDDIVHLMFDLQQHFFKYQLWNALQLPSSNQQRMYEILKQYEHAGVREISLKDLREFLGLRPDEYLRWNNFKTRILEPSQKALETYTDIKFTWEIVKRRGKGGKISNLRFNILKNEDYIRQLTFNEFLTEQLNPEISDETQEFERPHNDIITFLSEACDSEFNPKEIAVLHSLITRIVPHSTRWNLDMYDYLHGKYVELNWRATQKIIKSRFGYLKKIIESSLID